MSDRRTKDRRSAEPRRDPIFSKDAEFSLLGALLIENAHFDTISSRLEGRMFYREAHRTIYKRMLGLRQEGRPVDLTTLKTELDRHTVPNGETELEDVGVGYMASLVDGVPRATNASHYADIIAEKWRLRQLAESGQQLVDGAYALEESKTLMQAIDAKVSDLVAASRLTIGARSLATAMPEAMAEFERRSKNRGQLSGVTSGFPKLDYMTHGWEPGAMSLIAAKTHVGKSTLAVNFAKAFLQQQQPTLYYSYEMKLQSLLDRLLSDLSGIPAERIAWWNLNDEEQKAIGQWLEVLHDWPLHVNDVSGRTVEDIYREARQVKREHGLAAIFVDHFQLMKGVGEDSRLEYLESSSRELREIAIDLNVHMFVVSQLTTEKAEKHKAPTLDDLRWCKALGHDCDFAWFLHPHNWADIENDQPVVPMQLICRKNRLHGRLGSIWLNLERDFVRFVEAEAPAPKEPAVPRTRKAASPASW